MALAPGTRLGAYDIVALIGSGGMGEVYRARDSRLNRDVAIKVLPADVAADHDRLARFEREAQVLASLNHPNIAQIHGVDDSSGTPALVMELVEGPTLADRIAKGPIPLDEALPIAKQIAEALEAAHEQGIIHRDLKPANIKVRSDGTVKVLDFGLAKAFDPVASAVGNATMSPTLSIHATQAGLIMGTAAYMAPEQVRGGTVDRRADIWAFGVVLYEMLVGRRLFEGDTASDTLASVLREPIPLESLPADTAPSIRRLLRRCLERDQKRRLHHIADVRLELDDHGDSSTFAGVGPAAAPSTPSLQARVLPWAAASVLLAALGGLSFTHFREAVPAVPLEMRLEINTPATGHPSSFALSPDGRMMVFTGTADEQSSLWLRSLDSGSAKPLRGTEGGIFPFWSPDSRSVGFFADAKLKRIDVDTGSLLVLANTNNAPRGGTWNRDGVILFAPRSAQGILRVAAAGGEPSPVTRLLSTQIGHVFPQFLPDGRHFLFYGIGRPDKGVYIGQLDAQDARRVIDADTAATYASLGYLLFGRQDTLFGQRFDPVRLTLIADAVPISDQAFLESDPTARMSPVSASATGLIAHRTGTGVNGQQFVWVDRSGKELEKVGASDRLRPGNPALSPDGRHVVLDRTLEGNSDLWMLELSRGIPTRLTSDPAIDAYPLWSPDGKSIVFASNRKGVFDLYQMPAAGGQEELLLATPLSKVPLDWSRDRRFLLYVVADPKTGSDLWALRLDGDRKPFPVVQTTFTESGGQFSPNGKWVAFHSNTSGRLEVYIQSFPGPGPSNPVSTTGGAQPRWRPDGKELFYIGLDGRLMAVSITIAATGTVEPGVPVPLFPTHIGGAVPGGTSRQNYMVSPDGQRFLMNTVVSEGPVSPITVILNWKGPKP
jgi:Tol biopolymer transport system component